MATDSTGTPYAGVWVNEGFGHGDLPATYVAVVKVLGGGGFSLVSQVSGDFFTHKGDGSLAIDPQGDIFALDSVDVVEGPSFVAALSEPNSFADGPAGIAVGPGGVLYVTDPSNQSLDVLKPMGTAPNIFTGPSGATIAYGTNTTFAVTASGSPQPTFQWQVDGVDIPGATGSTYATSMPGTRTVVVTNSAGTVTSVAATLKAATRLLQHLKPRREKWERGPTWRSPAS